MTRDPVSPAERAAAQRARDTADRKRGAAPDPVVAFAALVDDLYKPEGVAIWWGNFAASDPEKRARMVRNLHIAADGAFA